MSKIDTSELKKFLTTKMRQHVPHPDIDGENVRVEKVAREWWIYRSGNWVRKVEFKSMNRDQIRRIAGVGA